MRRAVVFALGLAVIGVAAPARADEAAEPDDVDVVGAGGAARSASSTTRDHDVVTAAPHRTASDVLTVVPGVFVTQHSGEGKAHQIFLRGFDAVHGQDLELWVGGVPVNEVSNVHGQGYADLHFAMPEVIDSVTSTPGTFDPRQGDFAVAGTVRMKLGYAEPGGTIKGALGSFGARRLFLAYHPAEASKETFAAFEEYATDGFGPNRAARRGSLIAQGVHAFDEKTSARLMGSIYSGRFDSAGVVPAADIESGKIDRFAVLDPRQNGHSTRTQVLGELRREEKDARWSLAPFLVFRTLHLRQNFTGYYLDTVRGGKPRLDSDNNQQLNESVTLGMTASYDKRIKLLSARDSFALGVYGRHDVITQSQRRLSEVNDAPLETLVDADVRGTDIAGWVDLSVSPVERFFVRGGARLDALSYSAQDRVVGTTSSPVSAQGRAAQGAFLGKKLTLDYAIGGGFRALASYGEGFRSPQARSLSEGQKTFFTEVTSYEAGLKYTAGPPLTASLAGFYSRLSEDLVFDPATTRNETVPGTARKGVAAELVSQASDWLLLASSATYTHASFLESNAQYDAGALLPYVPQLVVRTDAIAKTKLARLWERDLVGRIGTGLQGLVTRPLPFGETGRDVFLVDASAGIRLKEIELGIDGYNVLDARWYDGQFVYASNFSRAANPPRVPFRHVSVGPPRTLFFTLTLFV